jgi:hypothetical protein
MCLSLGSPPDGKAEIPASAAAKYKPLQQRQFIDYISDYKHDVWNYF